MAEIRDQIGRIGNFQDAAIEKLSSMLNAAVGKAVKYASEKAKSAVSEKDYEKLSKALEDLGDDLKESLKSTEKFVDEVKQAVKSFEKTKQSRRASASENKGSLESIQREQTKILGMILENQKKAQSAKLAKYTSGGSSIGSKAKMSLGDLGFKPKGSDRVPAMLSPGEFIVNRRGASRNSRILDKINKGYSLGGLVKPRYFEKGGNTAPGATGTSSAGGNPWASVGGTMGRAARGRAEFVVESVELDAVAAAEAEKVGKKITEHINKGLKSGGNKELASWFTGMSTALMGGGADFLQGLFAGSVTDAMDFQREMRHIAFQTKGITGDFRDMQSSFSDLGKVAAETGKSVGVMQRVYMSNLKKGFKDNREGMKVMKSGLFLSTMIGSEAEQTADLFGDWHRTLALSSNEMGELARGMRNVDLSTGVTGDELLGAMKSSEGILKNLREQGNLTADVSKTVIQMMAEAKKTGFEESTGKILGALSGTSNIMDADSATQGLIYTISNRMGGGATDSVLSGTFMKDRANLAGFSSELMNLVGDLSDGAIKSLEDFDKLSDAQKKDLTLRLRGYGLSIAQAQSLISTTQKASKGLAGNIEDLEKIGSSKFATKAEKELANKQKSQAYLGASLDYLAAIGDEAKDKSLSDALKDSSTDEDFKNKRQDFTAMAGALTSEMKSAYGIGGTSEQMAQQLASMDPQRAAELNALVLGDQLNKAAKERGVSLDKDYASEIKNALAKGDNAKYRELVDEAQKKASEIAVEEQAASTPEAKLALEINKLNETIRGYTSSFVRSMVDYIGWIGLLYIQIGLLVSTLASTMGTNLLDFAFNLKGMFSKGGTLSTMFQPFIKGFTRARAAGGGIGGALQRGAYGQMMSSSIGRQMMSFARPLGGILQKALGPAVLVLGGIKGAMEAKEAGRTKTEGAILGALTGGAKTGSFMSSTLGLKKGGAADKALGVAGGAAWGAAAGAAIGSAFFGVGAAPGALIGAIIGGVVEMVKIITEGTDILQDIFSPVQVIVDFIYNRLVSLWDIVAGIFTLDFGRVFKGIFNLIVGSLLLIPRLIGSAIQAVFIGIPKLILKTISLIWEIPRMLGQALYNGIASLADNEWVGPIFATLRDALGALGEGLMAIWTPISQVFSGLYNVFSDLGKAIFGTSEEGGLLAGVMWVLKNTIWGISKVIGFLLYPLVLLAKALGFVLKMVGKLISGIIYPFQYLYDVLVGHSIVPDLVTGVIKWFAMLPSKIFNALLSVPSMIGKAFSNIGSYLQSFGTDGIFSTLLSNLGAFYSFVGSTIGNLVNLAKSVFKILGGILTLDFGMIWEGIKGIGSAIVSQFYNAGNLFYTMIKNTTKFFFKMMKKIPIMIFNGLKAVFFDLPKYLLSMLGDVLWSVGNFFFFTLPKILWNAFWDSLKSIGEFVYDTLMWPFEKIGEGLHALFIDLPIWLGTKLMEGLQAVFVDFPTWLGTKFMEGLHSIFVDLPNWLGKTIVDGMSSIWEYVPGAVYKTLHGAASSVGLGWLFEKIAGKPKASAADTASARLKERSYKTTNTKTSVPVYQDRREGPLSATHAASRSIEMASASAATPVGHHAVPVARPSDQDVGSVQPVHLRDITDSILRERAGTSGTGKVHSDELSRIEEASFKQVEELEQIKEGITEMVALLKPKGTGVVGGSSDMGPGRTKDPKRPMHAAQFGKMKYGRAGGNANRSLVNNGEV